MKVKRCRRCGGIPTRGFDPHLGNWYSCPKCRVYTQYHTSPFWAKEDWNRMQIEEDIRKRKEK